MLRTLGELDYRPLFAGGRVPALVTLTLPGDWTAVAPTGQAFKGHLNAFKRRYERAWGEPLLAVWKLEFQRRGAPHAHLLMSPPPGRLERASLPASWRGEIAADAPDIGFPEWLSESWADVVAHPDPGERLKHRRAGTGVDYARTPGSTDPRRIGAYFAKHSTFAAKEYQHNVPPLWQQAEAGPGRFWGRWNMERISQEVAVDIATARVVARTARRWSSSRDRTQANRAIAQGRPFRKRLRPLMASGAGYVLVGNGTVFAENLARLLASSRSSVRRKVLTCEAMERWATGEIPDGMPDDAIEQVDTLWNRDERGAATRVLLQYWNPAEVAG